MIHLDVWEDKLPCDKVKYYNRTRMSLELFCRKLSVAQQVLLKDMKKSGYRYDEKSRTFIEA